MKHKVVAICGSTKKESSNMGLIKAIARTYPDHLDVTIFKGLAELPQFNPDLDNDTPPEKISAFRRLLRSNDGILICTPEYAMGVPGALKNALDWTVSSMEFSHKPVALITASSQGEKGHRSLLETLLVIESNIPEESRLLISFVKTKIKGDEIVNETTKEEVNKVIESFMKGMGA
jgi:chromate reductase, NAD(P)H dehydrogenase (quinone)